MTHPVLIGLDWGTSSLRAMLIGDGGSVIEEVSRPWGIMRLPAGGFVEAYEAVTTGWQSAWPELPCIACGMVGSRQGWLEAQYCSAPAGPDELAARLAVVDGISLNIVPGIVEIGSHSDVMRGEETQVIGALGPTDSRLVVLPGSHSKWVDVQRGRVAAFRTFMTGEVFAALRDNTILGAFASAEKEAGDGTAFDRGVMAARRSDGGVAPMLFSARALVLTGGLAAGDALDYLSGLLIGDELRATPPGAAPLLIGDEALCRRYLRAMTLCDIAGELAASGAAAAGLWRIAVRAGLIANQGGNADVG